MESDLIKVPVFAGIGESSLQVLAAEGELNEVSPGTSIVREGEPGHEMYIIRSGRVEVIKHHGEADETKICELGEADFFGEMCIVEPMPRAATVRSVEPCVLVELPTAAFQHLYNHSMEDFNVVILNIARDLARRLRHLDDVFAAKAH